MVCVSSCVKMLFAYKVGRENHKVWVSGGDVTDTQVCDIDKLLVMCLINL